IPVCHAMQHAHQKGIIHRDLKPSNILVALYDGKPVPKVIDFGIAKATGPRLTDQSVYTEVGSLVGTLEYMSPEQAELNNLDIDTRSDVYALGVVEARPPTAGYKLRKFARKNRKVLVTAGAFLVLLGAATVVSTWQAIRATRAEAAARASADQAQLNAAEAERNARQAREES